MKIAVAGDSAGEGLASVLAEHLSASHDVTELSRTENGPDAFYADLSDRVASAVLAGTYDRAILVCGTGIGVCLGGLEQLKVLPHGDLWQSLPQGGNRTLGCVT